MKSSNHSLRPSIRRRLISVLLVFIVAAWLVTTVMSYIKTRQEVETLFDAQLAQLAYALSEISSKKTDVFQDDEILMKAIEAHSASQPYSKKIAFQIWRDNKLVLRSRNAPITKLAEGVDYHDRMIEGRQWRVFAFASDHLLVEVGEDTDIRSRLVRSIVLDMLLPMLIALPIIASMIWIGIGAGISPLYRIVRAIRKRSHHQLSPIAMANIPVEIEPLVKELNSLLGRLDDAFTKERNFTANASHELRTPLAVIKAQAQVALRSRSEKERREHLKKVIIGIDRATHMVNQLLTLARIDPDAVASLYKMLNLTEVTSYVIADLAPIALKKKIDISLVSEEGVMIRGYRDGIQLMLTNLIDNAISYTPEGKAVRIRIEKMAGEVAVIIQDSGPGIPETERDKVFDRFYRMPGAKASGCGIGLAIVKRVVDLHDARILLENPRRGTGLVVKILFETN